MRIKALRLSNVRCFLRPVVIDGFAPGLNVLTGPNEMGKSTVLRALRAVFLDSETIQGRKLKALTPHSGGVPEITVRFEVSGRDYRLEKTFHRSRGRAVLSDERTGQELAQRADVRSALDELLFGSDTEDASAWLSLLWAEQKSVLEPTELHPKTQTSLRGLAEREIGARLGGSGARQVREAAGAFLTQQLTATGRVKKGGPLDVAQRTVADLEAKVASAREAATAAQARLDELSSLEAERQLLSAPDAVAIRERAAFAATQALETARAHAERLKAAETEAALAQRDVSACEGASRSLEEDLDRLQALQSEEMRLADALRTAEEALAVAELEQKTLRREREAVGNTLTALEQVQRHQEQMQRVSERASRVAEANEQVERAQVLQRQVLQRSEALDGNAVTSEVMRRAEALDARIQAAHQAREAAAPSIHLEVEPGAERRVVVDGVPVGSRLEKRVIAAVEVGIAGIGKLTVLPSEQENVVSADQDTHALAELLAAHAATTLEDLWSRGNERRHVEQETQALAAELRGLAPDGVERLTELCAELERVLAEEKRGLEELEHDVRTSCAEADLEVETSELNRRRRENATRQTEILEALDAVERQLRTLTVDVDRLREAERIRCLDVGTLVERLPAPEDRGSALEAARSALADARVKAVATESARRQALVDAPSAADLDRLAQDAAHASQTLSVADARLNEIAVSVARLEAMLSRDRHDGVVGNLATLEAELHEARRAQKGLEAEIAAHQLLIRTLEAVEETLKERVARPILERLDPYVELLFPKATLTLDDALAVREVGRPGEFGDDVEAVETLSDGTQEQIAVLTRLGLARARADAGRALPLVLDDALVFADDERLARAFDALRLAAAHHQVFVLTCRASQFAALGGTSLSLRSADADPTSRSFAA